MATSRQILQVALAPNGFYPRSFRWQGQTVRVLSVESVNTHGAERRLRVRTSVGFFDLGLFSNSGLWRIRREPNWLDRAWARIRRMPRYPLPPWRRRVYRPVMVRHPVPVSLKEGESYANRFALVRQ